MLARQAFKHSFRNIVARQALQHCCKTSFTMLLQVMLCNIVAGQALQHCCKTSFLQHLFQEKLCNIVARQALLYFCMLHILGVTA
jgi:hypothetical protein